MRIAGDEQFRSRCLGKREKLVVLRINAISDGGHDLYSVSMLDETGNKGVTLSRAGVAIELGARQYGLQLCQGRQVSPGQAQRARFLQKLQAIEMTALTMASSSLLEATLRIKALSTFRSCRGSGRSPTR